MSRWKNIVGRWGSGVGETDDVRIDGSTNSLQTGVAANLVQFRATWYEHTDKHN